MFCCRSEASLLSSGRSVSPLHGRYGQSVREQALRSLGREDGDAFSQFPVSRGSEQGVRRAKGGEKGTGERAARGSARQKVQICALLRL